MSGDLTVCITTYNRPEMLRDCLETVVPQVAEVGAKLVVLDNCSDTNVEPLVSGFSGQCAVQFVRHDRNLGAFGNGRAAMKKCTETQFGMVFHDDDLMMPGLLSRELALMRERPELLFVCTGMKALHGEPGGRVYVFPDPEAGLAVYRGAAMLARAIIRGAPLHLGSAMYRSDVLGRTFPDEDKYGGLSDRPFLLSIAEAGPVARICEPLVAYRQHDDQDSKTLTVHPKDLRNLMVAYRTALLSDSLHGDKTLFLDWSTNAVFKSFAQLPGACLSSMLENCASARHEGLFEWWRLRRTVLAESADIMGCHAAAFALRPMLSCRRLARWLPRRAMRP
jgi:glycosyltransferase involved in cell wall biosynthesis